MDHRALRFALAQPFGCGGPDSDDAQEKGCAVVFSLDDVYDR